MIARATFYIERQDLEKWEAAGWRAISHYANRSNDIESIIIGWFEEGEPVCPNPST